MQEHIIEVYFISPTKSKSPPSDLSKREIERERESEKVHSPQLTTIHIP